MLKEVQMKCKTCGKEVTELEYSAFDSHGKRFHLCDDCLNIADSVDPIPYEPVRPKVYSCDLDNTLSIGSAWTCDECETLEPRQDAIDKINELYEHNFIVIHTARRHGLYGSTIKWLERNGVRYHALRFEKMPCDIIFDLDAVNRVEDL